MHAKNLVAGLALSLVAACGSAESEGLYGDPGEADPERRSGSFAGGAQDAAGAGGSGSPAPPAPTTSAAPDTDASSPEAGVACDDEQDKPGKGKGKGRDPSGC